MTGQASSREPPPDMVGVTQHCVEERGLWSPASRVHLPALPFTGCVVPGQVTQPLCLLSPICIMGLMVHTPRGTIGNIKRASTQEVLSAVC